MLDGITNRVFPRGITNMDRVSRICSEGRPSTSNLRYEPYHWKAHLVRPRWPKILVVVRRMLPGEHHGAMKQMNEGDTGEGGRCRARHVPVQSEFSLDYVITT